MARYVFREWAGKKTIEDYEKKGIFFKVKSFPTLRLLIANLPRIATMAAPSEGNIIPTVGVSKGKGEPVPLGEFMGCKHNGFFYC